MKPFKEIRVAYVGNFSINFCTESHIAGSLKDLGCTVTKIQEGETRTLDIPRQAQDHDLLLWTQTYGLAESGGTREERFQMLQWLRDMNIPSVGFHLDKWWDLPRQQQIYDEPFFRVDWLFTADGGNQDRFQKLGINHYWSPPGIYKQECILGNPVVQWNRDIGFVGNHRGGYHPEWRHRAELIRFLQRTYRSKCGFWPNGRDTFVYNGIESTQFRGSNLSNLYASVKVLVGDSCLIGNRGFYFSDRIPETLGRGGFLLHPWFQGIDEQYTDGKHLRLWHIGDWGELRKLIAYYIEHDEERKTIALEGHRHVLENHTYENRMCMVLETVLSPSKEKDNGNTN